MGKQAVLGRFLDLPSPSSSGSTALKHTLAAGWGSQGYDGIVEQWRSGDFKWKT